MSQSSPLARLWAHAQAALTALCASLMPLDTLLLAERRQLRAWLQALEVFCRRIALTEALARLGDTRSPTDLSKHATQSAMSVCHPARVAANRRPVLRLWPKLKRSGARIRLLGAPSSVREIQAEQQRAALTARLAAGRARHKPAHLRIADRIEALQRFLDAPLGAIRRFARKLAQVPSLARAIVARRAPACPFLAPEEVSACDTLSCAAALNTS